MNLHLNEIVFCGGGCSGLWYCFQYAQEYIRQDEFYNIYGYSSGAIVACLVALKVPPNIFYGNIFTIIKQNNSCFSSGILRKLVPLLEKLIPENAIEILNANNSNIRLHILLCDLINLKTKVISSWSSRQELIECITSSCFIPFVTSFSYYSRKYNSIDGGMSSDLPKYFCNKHIILVPTLSFSTWVTQFYPSIRQVQIYYRLGQNDGKNAIIQKKCIKYKYDGEKINPFFFFTYSLFYFYFCFKHSLFLLHFS